VTKRVGAFFRKTFQIGQIRDQAVSQIINAVMIEHHGGLVEAEFGDQLRFAGDLDVLIVGADDFFIHARGCNAFSGKFKKLFEIPAVMKIKGMRSERAMRVKIK
jgi:hypothetical protein